MKGNLTKVKLKTFFSKLNLKKILVIALTLIPAAFFMLTGLSGCSGSESQEIETFTVLRGDIVESITSTGAVDAREMRNYSLTQSAKVLEIIEKGKEFKKGDTLIRIDDSKNKLYVSQAETNLELAGKSIEMAKINYQSALDANHVAVQLVESNNNLAATSTQNAFKAMEGANTMADANIRAARNAISNAEFYMDEIEDDPYSTTSLEAQAEVNIESAEDAYKQAKESSQAQTNSAEGAYNQALINQSITYWSGINSLETALAQIKLMSKSIEQAELQYELSKINIELVETDSDNYSILAPFDGIVFNSNFAEGETAGPGVAAISVISKDLLVKSDINETDITKLSIDQESELTFDAYPELSFKGKITDISPLSENIAGIVSFEITVEPDKEAVSYLKYGLSVNLSVIISKVENVLYIPIQSVYSDNGKSYVDKIDEKNVIEKVEITTGNYNYDYIEVKSGLAEGDTVVISITDSTGNETGT